MTSKAKYKTCDIFSCKLETKEGEKYIYRFARLREKRMRDLDNIKYQKEEIRCK